MEEIKEAFSRVREDMDNLYTEIDFLKQEIKQMKELVLNIYSSVENSKKNKVLENDLPTNNSIIPTHSTDIPADIGAFRGLKTQKQHFSTGNGGVPTDRQTDQQTDRPTDNSSHNTFFLNNPSSIERALTILDSLDNLKKEIRIKFKRLTDQEMSVFVTLYQISEKTGFCDYKTLSERLNLTESSIRDYVGKIIKKGIPVEKTKINNKTIQLSVSLNLKKVASLQTIMQLREI